MGLFICLNNSSYKIREHAKLETDLIRDHGFQLMLEADYDRLMRIVSTTYNENGESFCKRVKDGVSIGMMTSTLVGSSIRMNTVLILTTKDAVEEIDTMDDIRAILAFNYEDDENKLVDINALCSNQLTRSRGGGLLIGPLIDVCRENQLNAIILYSSDSGVEFYKKKGFENAGDARFPNKMVLRLSSGAGAKKTKKRRTKRR
jgi:hypothetical protein